MAVKRVSILVCCWMAVMMLLVGCGSKADDPKQPNIEGVVTESALSVDSEDADLEGVDPEDVNSEDAEARQSDQTTVPPQNHEETNGDIPVTTENQIVIEGSGVKEKMILSLADIKAMDHVSYTYFSRGKEPKEAYNTYTGVLLSSILEKAGMSSQATKVRISALDGYSASFAISDVTAMRIDETDLTKELPMIIAYSEDGGDLDAKEGTFKLAMGQQFEGDYNRQYWVKQVCTITVD